MKSRQQTDSVRIEKKSIFSNKENLDFLNANMLNL